MFCYHIRQVFMRMVDKKNQINVRHFVSQPSFGIIHLDAA